MYSKQCPENENDNFFVAEKPENQVNIEKLDKKIQLKVIIWVLKMFVILCQTQPCKYFLNHNKTVCPK